LDDLLLSLRDDLRDELDLERLRKAPFHLRIELAETTDGSPAPEVAPFSSRTAGKE
jgi:hypothetical protein